VFPYAYHRPPGVIEQLVCLGIALAVARDLLAPELLISLWRPVMIGAAVPETAVHEDSDTCTGED
jgi:hypothetical protein